MESIMNRCRHCGQAIWFDPEFTVHCEDGEWLSEVSQNICESNPDGYFDHDPETIMRKHYTEQEIADINRRARTVANKSSIKRMLTLNRFQIGVLVGTGCGIWIGYIIARFISC